MRSTHNYSALDAQDANNPSLAPGVRILHAMSAGKLRHPGVTCVVVLSATLAFTTAAISADERTGSKPNIVFMLADDAGLGDFGCYGHPHAHTPNIDRLASEGTRFTQFYSTGATCCPARTGLMTSKFPATYPVYPANGGFAERVTITELLNQAGYRTGHFGKWHIGPNETSGTYGIDVVGSDAAEVGGKGQRDDPRGRDANIYDQAIRFIEENRDQPFYVNVWGHISHHPVDPVQSLVDRWNRLEVNEAEFSAPMREKFETVRHAGGDVNDALRRYLADIESLDRAVGRLLQRLDELGLRENTLVIFSSDQGADMTKAGLGGVRFNQMGYNGEYRGGKHTLLEGGVRVPWILRLPGRIPANRVDEHSVLSGIDYLPTLCELTGVDIIQDDFDGESTLEAWLGQSSHQRTKPLLWKASSPGAQAVVRDGKWKLFHPARKNAGDIELYDIESDSMESRNLAEEMPQVAQELTRKVEAWVGTLPRDYIKTNDKQD